MADQEQVDLLKQGVDVWNAWREKNPVTKIDLSDIYFPDSGDAIAFTVGDDLRGVNFSDANLSGSDFGGVDLCRANLSGADLSNSNFNSVKLSGANLSNVRLCSALIEFIDFKNTLLKGANFTLARFHHTDLAGVSLKGVNLNSADFTDCNFKEAILDEADFSYARLNGEDLRNSNLSNTNFSGACFRHSNLRSVDFQNTNLHEADFQNADLGKANLKKANLRGANLTLANLYQANLSYSNLSEANLLNADIIGADLSMADLSNSYLIKATVLKTNFYCANLNGVCIQDWNTNEETNLEGVICEYIFMKSFFDNSLNKAIPTERCPKNPSQNFELGEFTKRFQISRNILELTFQDGMPWKAFAQVFNDVNQKVLKKYDSELYLQEYKVLGDSLVTLKIVYPADADGDKLQEELQGKVQLLEKSKLENARLKGKLEEKSNSSEEKDNTIQQLIRMLSWNEQLERGIELGKELGSQSISNTGDNVNIVAGSNNSQLHQQEKGDKNEQSKSFYRRFLDGAKDIHFILKILIPVSIFIIAALSVALPHAVDCIKNSFNQNELPIVSFKSNKSNADISFPQKSPRPYP